MQCPCCRSHCCQNQNCVTLSGSKFPIFLFPQRKMNQKNMYFLLNLTKRILLFECAIHLIKKNCSYTRCFLQWPWSAFPTPLASNVTLDSYSIHIPKENVHASIHITDIPECGGGSGLMQSPHQGVNEECIISCPLYVQSSKEQFLCP